MRRIIEDTLVNVSRIEGRKAFITVQEGERILKSGEEYIPTIHLIGCRSIFLTLNNLENIKSIKKVKCYIEGNVEEFQSDEKLEALEWKLQLSIINNIKEQLLRIARPVINLELGGVSKFYEGGQGTRIERLYLDLNWNIWIEHENGMVQDFYDAVFENYIPFQRSLPLLHRLQKIHEGIVTDAALRSAFEDEPLIT